MIKNWSEIQSRYDAIKDHKPRATKKLNELGDILASAYAIDPDEADSMWQYIVDLNVADDITFSKFYIAQVFNKLTDRMKPEDATAFLTMTPERVQLMINYGYDGGTLWHCLNVLVKGYLIARDVDNAITCIATVYKGNIIKNLIMDCQSYTKYRPNETTGGIFVSWRRKEELPTGA